MEDEGGSSWLMRLSRKEGRNPLVIALEPHHGARSFLLPVPEIVLPQRREWPECRGLEWLTVEIGGIVHWGVRLRDKQCSDVFTALAQDLDRRLHLVEGSEPAAAEIFGRLKLWQQFLKVWQEGMGLEAARGLWGELHFLNEYLLCVMQAGTAVRGWTAGTGAHQDFQFPSVAVEIKTTAAKQPQSVRITSERQLDETGAGELFLVVLIVDDREIATGGTAAGTSLPQLIESVRKNLAASPPSLLLFNDLLLQRGWMDQFSPRHETRRITVREELLFHIRPGFPRLIETDLPTGVGDANYALALAACEPFRIVRASLIEVLAATNHDIPF